MTVALIDFIDPERAHEPDARERGVRLEVRPARWTGVGSIYASRELAVDPAVLRIDLLESAPRAADRMHWHPRMVSGEPGRRSFEPDIAADPVGWVRWLLHDLHEWVGPDAAADIAGVAEPVADEVDRLLARARQPWPDVTRDDRGLAVG